MERNASVYQVIYSYMVTIQKVATITAVVL